MYASSKSLNKDLRPLSTYPPSQNTSSYEPSITPITKPNLHPAEEPKTSKRAEEPWEYVAILPVNLEADIKTDVIGVESSDLQHTSPKYYEYMSPRIGVQEIKKG